jgi:hypothetical protein
MKDKVFNLKKWFHFTHEKPYFFKKPTPIAIGDKTRPHLFSNLIKILVKSGLRMLQAFGTLFDKSVGKRFHHSTR